MEVPPLIRGRFHLCEVEILGSHRYFCMLECPSGSLGRIRESSRSRIETRIYIYHFLSMGRDLLKLLAACGPEGPALRARRARSGPEGPARGPEGPARASVARPLYLKLMTRQTKLRRLDRQKCED